MDTFWRYLLYNVQCTVHSVHVFRDVAIQDDHYTTIILLCNYPPPLLFFHSEGGGFREGDVGLGTESVFIHFFATEVELWCRMYSRIEDDHNVWYIGYGTNAPKNWRVPSSGNGKRIVWHTLKLTKWDQSITVFGVGTMLDRLREFLRIFASSKTKTTSADKFEANIIFNKTSSSLTVRQQSKGAIMRPKDK